MYKWNNCKEKLLFEVSGEKPRMGIIYAEDLPHTMPNTKEIIESFPKMGETIKLSKGTLLTTVPSSAYVMQNSFISRDEKGFAIDIVVTGYTIKYPCTSAVRDMLPRIVGETQTFDTFN